MSTDIQTSYDVVSQQLTSSDTNNDALYFLENIISTGLVEKVSINSDGYLLILLRGAYASLDSINKLIDVCKKIHGDLANKQIPLIREWVDRVLHLHPKIYEEIKRLQFFQPISEDVGATYLATTPDTQTLTLEDWNGNKPIPIRKNVEQKLGNVAKNILLGANNTNIYQNLNKSMINNMSTEYYRGEDFYGPGEQTIEGGALNSTKTIYNNDFHVVGDYTYHEKHLSDTTQSNVKSTLESGENFGDSTKLINYLYPINNLAIAEDLILKVVIETKEFDITLKGDRNVEPYKFVNDAVLDPKNKKNTL